MPTVGTATIKLKMDGVNNVVAGFKKIGASAVNVGKMIFKAIGVVAVAGFAALLIAGKKVLQIAIAQEDAEAKLVAVLKATGGAAGFTAKQLFKQAEALQAITKFGDETIIGGQALLATFKQIKGDEFKRATAAMLDMSTVMDQDLKGSAIQLGKALNDPIKGVASLNRVGVTFSQVQIDMIKRLQESGDLMGAQAVILDELEGQFKGAAVAAGDTFGGQIAKLKNFLGDLGEEAGFVLIAELKKLVGGFDLTGDAAQNMKVRVRQAAAFIVDSVKIIVLFAQKLGLELIQFFSRWKTIIQGIVTVIKGAAKFIMGAVRLMTLGIVKLNDELADIFGDQIDPVGAARQKKIQEISNQISELVDNLGRIPDARKKADAGLSPGGGPARVAFEPADKDQKKKLAKKIKEKIKVQIQPEFIGVSDLFRKIQLGLTKSQAKKAEEEILKKQLAAQKKQNAIGLNIVKELVKINGGPAGIAGDAPGTFG